MYNDIREMYKQVWYRCGVVVFANFNLLCAVLIAVVVIACVPYMYLGVF